MSGHLHVRTWGDRGAREQIVLVHGFPDSSSVWDAIAERLAADYFVVAYDVRGAGGSFVPEHQKDYALSELIGDLARVIDEHCTRPVHLVGHDWGSIASWEAVTDPTFRHRLASFTSISGPCLDHVGHAMRRDRASMLGQLSRSWYAVAFQLPFAARMWRTIGPAWPSLMRRMERIDASPGDRARDGANGVNLYRENMLARVRAPRERRTDLPVQLIVPTRDRYVEPAMLEDVARWAPHVWRRDVVAGHWSVLADAPLFARWMHEWIDNLVLGRIDRDAKLAVVTGGASGIGRATALELIDRGYEVVIADLDLAGAKTTAELGVAMGGRAHAYALDVADAAAMTKFASMIRERHGVANLVVNNAGIAIAGGFMATTEREWDRLFAINVDGVARGCRLFAQQMIDAKQPGHLVNIASAAAFAPSRRLSVYSTSKAAVVMLSECLRAELAHHAIGVTAVCPGLVDTPITTATRYAGADATSEAKQRRGAARAYRMRGLGPDRVAREICDGIEGNLPIVHVGAEASVLHWLSRFAPAVSRRIARV